MSHNRIIYYYQTFTGLKPILEQDPIKVTHIHLAAFHFGLDENNKEYIHLNNYSPDNPKFKSVWQDIKSAYEKGIKIIYMIGGSGGAYDALFSNFETYYKLLQNTLKNFPYAAGVDLDVEQYVGIENIKKLINRINEDYGTEFIISMAPVANSLTIDENGMGGFIYKELYDSKEGKCINYFNGQFYGCYNKETYDAVIKNGYPSSQVVFGMVSSDFSKSTFNNACDIIESIKNQYDNFGGVFVWEYFDCPPGSPTHSEEWSNIIYKILNPSNSCLCCFC